MLTNIGVFEKRFVQNYILSTSHITEDFAVKSTQEIVLYILFSELKLDLKKDFPLLL